MAYHDHDGKVVSATLPTYDLDGDLLPGEELRLRVGGEISAHLGEELHAVGVVVRRSESRQSLPVNSPTPG
jgi:hypothetical protein